MLRLLPFLASLVLVVACGADGEPVAPGLSISGTVKMGVASDAAQVPAE